MINKVRRCLCGHEGPAGEFRLVNPLAHFTGLSYRRRCPVCSRVAATAEFPLARAAAGAAWTPEDETKFAGL